jgi:GDP-L-fucose synthase
LSWLSGKRIFVAGHRGLAGSAITRQLQRRGHTGLLLRTHAELDLEDARQSARYFAEQRPEVVFLAAAKVGGILANNAYPADFLFRNLRIEANVIEAAAESGVERLIFLGSSCIYPRDCPQPIKEKYLLTGPLEATNRPYALAKIAGVEMCWSLNRQHGKRFLAAMPTNLYGPGDNYDLQNSHVLPALIRKCHEAKTHGAAEVVLWGTGTPRREFLFSDDLGAALVHLADLPDQQYARLVQPDVCPLINVGTGEDLSIRELAELVAQAIGYTGRFVQDTSKPDGTPRKVLDVSRLRSFGWRPETGLLHGIAMAYRGYLSEQGTEQALHVRQNLPDIRQES